MHANWLILFLFQVISEIGFEIDRFPLAWQYGKNGAVMEEYSGSGMREGGEGKDNGAGMIITAP